VRVTAIVVAWNAADDLPACLDALQGQDHPDLEVVVVDNASHDATPEVLRAAVAASADGGATERGAAANPAMDGSVRRSHGVRAVWNPTNRGFCGGVNDALATMGDEVEAVLLVNPDAVAAPDLVRRAVAVLASRPEVGTVQPRLQRRTAPDAPVTIDTTGHVLTSARLVNNRGEGEPDDGRHPPGEVFGASGALVLHRRAMLDDVAWRSAATSGGERSEYLTEDLFAYFDDVELDWRAQLHGWRAWYEPTAVGVHERGGAGPRRTPRVEALNYANRLLVIATCDGGRSPLRSAPLVAVTTLLKTLELAVTVPSALPEAFGRLRLLPAARRRRRVLRGRRRTVPFGEVTARWVEPFRWRPWIAAWWTRTRR
jgi:GT2 family glycosyltransferase